MYPRRYAIAGDHWEKIDSFKSPVDLPSNFPFERARILASDFPLRVIPCALRALKTAFLSR
jgi:hypothetical protein